MKERAEEITEGRKVMEYTKKKVLYYNVLKWQYLYDHPSKTSVYGVEDLREIKDFIHNCALCEYNKKRIDCKRCYLAKICKNEYHRWLDAETPKTRKKYAGIILEACKKMTIKDL